MYKIAETQYIIKTNMYVQVWYVQIWNFILILNTWTWERIILLRIILL